MFDVHDRAPKNRVLMSSSYTGQKYQQRRPFARLFTKCRYEPNLNVLCRPSLYLIRYFLKQYYVSRSNIGFICPSYFFRFKRAPCMCFCFGCGRAVLGPSVKYPRYQNRKKIICRGLFQILTHYWYWTNGLLHLRHKRKKLNERATFKWKCWNS